MMKTIFVMIKCELGQANKVAADIVDNVQGVSEVYSTSGEYDLLSKFNLEREADIGRFVTEVVQTRPGIRDTFTITTFSPFRQDTD
jgi:DNA-binding Lrp family transcriptional regulator